MRSGEVFPKVEAQTKLAGLWDDSMAEIERTEGPGKLRVSPDTNACNKS